MRFLQASLLNILLISASTIKCIPMLVCPTQCTCETSPNSDVSVVCNDRNLTRVPDVTEPLVKVTSLDLGLNDIESLSREFLSRFPRLEVFSVYMNSIEMLDPKTFVNLRQLRSIDLSDNLLSNIDPHMFITNRYLETLILSGNSLIEVSADRPLLVAPYLRHLDLGFCKLTAISSANLVSLGNLETLDLRSNDLIALPVVTLEHLSRLKTIDLSNNRWSCGCQLDALLSHVADKRKRDENLMIKPVRCLKENGAMKTRWIEAGLTKGPDCEIETSTIRVTSSSRSSTLMTVSAMEPVELREQIAFGTIFKFIDENAITVGAMLVMLLAFFITCAFSCFIVRCILRRDSSARHVTSSLKQNLELAFKDTGNERYSKILLLEPPRSPDIQHQTDPGDLYTEYLSRRPCSEHVYAEIPARVE